MIYISNLTLYTHTHVNLGTGGWTNMSMGINDNPSFSVKLELISQLNPVTKLFIIVCISFSLRSLFCVLLRTIKLLFSGTSHTKLTLTYLHLVFYPDIF